MNHSKFPLCTLIIITCSFVTISIILTFNSTFISSLRSTTSTHTNPFIPTPSTGNTTITPNYTVKGVFIYLTIDHKILPRNGKGVRQFELLLTALSNFDKMVSSPLNRKYPIMILHDGWASNQELSSKVLRAANESASLIRFAYMNVSIPDFFLKDPLRYKPQGTCIEAGASYRDMNRVFIRLMFEENSPLREFDYWMRLDTDILVTQKFNFDPFVVMKAGGFVFGYNLCNRQSGCLAGFKEFVENYVSKNQEIEITTVNGLDHIRKYTSFYGNVGVGDVKFFTSDRVLKYLRAIDENGGIYRERWGDQHVYFSVVMLFAHSNQTISMPKHFKVVHKGTNEIIGNPCNFNKGRIENGETFIVQYNETAMVISDEQGFKMLEEYGNIADVIMKYNSNITDVRIV
uniref:Nucleotide-diphospho-sugar transferase domain-containing protein n=1 Tax=Timspurckia oligopyrenoides TaxID=708627 RepID=A0A7S0ZDT0_9RHOD|mmetsp:Transcript_13876/g.24877  ORF Transcript_13876/g.24877 Transcript_13876/m.24877 type:complete len:403 (+) Transcript_13876:116-1324(+)|eukprot:CAMPEP_0182443426 /NCGR_PEP_ID=MMETSP1172-20130603/2162_1 /TAXON_ID=708627 /ORGANISM="Timspurckia oligopyrenoides, Strain CCMP3278" /LENGTH=402 /DNA_ID=CAMNT_0024638703 /DNA_START=66 /DNA_END=1277 /DNA_ORIENTATION=+